MSARFEADSIRRMSLSGVSDPVEVGDHTVRFRSLNTARMQMRLGVVQARLREGMAWGSLDPFTLDLMHKTATLKLAIHADSPEEERAVDALIEGADGDLLDDLYEAYQKFAGDFRKAPASRVEGGDSPESPDGGEAGSE